MAYKVFAEDISSPFSHMCFFTMANQSPKIEKMLSLRVKPALQEIINSKVKWCLEEKSFFTQAKVILKKLEDPRFYQKVVKESYSSLKDFQKAAFKVRRIDYSSLSLLEITRILKQLMKQWINATIWGVIINHSDFRFGLLSKKVASIVEKRVIQTKTRISPAEAFVLLTTPTKRSLVVNQEIELLEILKEIEKAKKLGKVKSIKDIEKIPSLFLKIKNHKEKYDWLQYGYIGPTILDESYFIKILGGFLKEEMIAEKKIKEITAKEKETKEKQKELKRKLKFRAKEWYWIQVAKKSAYLKGYRKEITFIASRALFPLLSEIGKRFNLSFRQTIQMSEDELFRALKTERIPSIDILNKRSKYCVVYYPQKKQMVYIGKKAKRLAQKIVEEKIEEEIKEIRGNTAYPGEAKGEVKLIFGPEDVKKMKKGNILVSPATNPNIMPAITRASAIITDEGGITCHAAIVSRELGIPCIIGTKIATKVLRDGDLVEVDANKGIIKILKK